MQYRLGRHNFKIVYRQDGENPSDSDPMVAIGMDEEQAKTIVDELNAGLCRIPRLQPENATREAYAIRKLIEECAELIKALSGGERISILEEMADVQAALRFYQEGLEEYEQGFIERREDNKLDKKHRKFPKYRKLPSP